MLIEIIGKDWNNRYLIGSLYNSSAEQQILTLLTITITLVMQYLGYIIMSYAIVEPIRKAPSADLSLLVFTGLCRSEIWGCGGSCRILFPCRCYRCRSGSFLACRCGSYRWKGFPCSVFILKYTIFSHKDSMFRFTVKVADRLYWSVVLPY